MAAGAQRTDSGLKVEAKNYMKEERRNGKILKNASAQWIDHGLIVVLQRMVKSRVGVEHQTTTYL